VGTSTVRLLEAAAHTGTVQPFAGWVDLFILPGYKFRVVDVMVTNFHLPRSTLLMLVSAFAGKDFILRAYEQARSLNYRFYSFGDAMLIF
jgi:S-adenosylmethionine:tRNA ribosyltransferase-isomerase